MSQNLLRFPVDVQDDDSNFTLEVSDAGNQTSDAGDATATGGEATAGETISGGATTGGGDTSGSTSDGSTDAPDTTTGTATSGTTGTTTDTDGVTAGTVTEGSVDSTGMNTATAGDTAGATTDGGATAGTDADGGDTSTTTSGQTVYPVGSLAYQINNPINEWTLFLPTNEAFEALDSPSDFDIQKHIAPNVFSFADLSTWNGLGLIMDDGRGLIVDGDGTPTDPLTIAESTLIRADIIGDTGTSVVHVIDTVIGESTGPDYPRGSLGEILTENEDVSAVLSLFAAEASRLILIDSRLEWTIFLPNNAALENAQDDFILDNHIYEEAVLKATDLTGQSGEALEMISDNSFEIGGGSTNEPLTIGGYNIIEFDVQREDMEGAVVHIIDGVLVPQLIQGD